MKLKAHEIARLIDISAVQAAHGKADIQEMVRAAKQYHFIAVHVLPCWVTLLRKELNGAPDVLLGAPVGFPSGGHRTEIKVAEAKLLAEDGVQEMDMMLNVGKLRSGDVDYCEREIRSVVDAVRPIPVKVIIEVHHLGREEIRQACEACIFAGAAFVKTASGWAASGATLEIVRYIKSVVGERIKVKAAGGIRGLDTLVKMHNMGVARFGINLKTAVEIVRAVESLPGGCIEA
jgi:deoxyribose-phosphate aldolase